MYDVGAKKREREKVWADDCRKKEAKRNVCTRETSQGLF